MTVTRGKITEMSTERGLNTVPLRLPPLPRKRNTVIAVTSERMGSGDDELGS
ncbi:MAG: hypothetical protein MZV63_32700 [Marinilabiliales bacterium]|nr:hypothetical protein [Marinilabiliales bacterium]